MRRRRCLSSGESELGVFDIARGTCSVKCGDVWVCTVEGHPAVDQVVIGIWLGHWCWKPDDAFDNVLDVGVVPVRLRMKISDFCPGSCEPRESTYQKDGAEIFIIEGVWMLRSKLSGQISLAIISVLGLG